MSTPPTNSGGHPPTQILAALIEGTLGEIDTACTRAHLSTCGLCLEAYEFAVRSRVAGVDQAGPAPSQAALRVAKQIAENGYRRTNFDRRGRGRWLAGIGPMGRFGVATAVIAMFVAAVFWLRPVSDHGVGFDPRSELHAPIATAMVDASSRQPIVFPGTEDDLAQSTTAYRSGPVKVTASLEKSLAALAELYTGGQASSDETQWLIGGYLATGQLSNARIYLDDARRRFDNATDFLLLDGLLAYHESRLEEARSSLETLVAADSPPVVAVFDLGVVLWEVGEREAARARFKEVIDLAPSSRIAGKARNMLQRSGSN